MSVFGIDLGTTNSCISRLTEGHPEVVAIAGQVTIPSIVRVSEDGQIVVGREARNLELQAPERCVRSVKRKMGSDHRYEIDNRVMTPEQVSAEILKALKHGAEAATGETVHEVVITVPAYFDDAQRHATLRAGELAGLQVLRLLNEPTSASLVYEQVAANAANAVDTQEATHGEASDIDAEATGAPTQLVLIYDLGGGTFDVSILETFEGVREVRSTAGNTQLGGDDFDRLLREHFEKHLEAQQATLDARARARLQRLAESTKIALSQHTSVDVREEFICQTEDGQPLHLDVQVTRRQFEAMVASLLESTIDLCRRALDDAHLEDQTLDGICLVGGSTRIPLVRTLLAEAFDVPIHEEVDPDLAVALGAAVQAALVKGLPTTKMLVDVTAHSLGIRVISNRDRYGEEPDSFAPVLHRNTVLPTERTEEFYTVVDNQEWLKVDVFQGEHHRASQNRQIGTFRYDLEPEPEGSPVTVRFAYDLDGIVQVSVAQPGKQNEKKVALSLADTGSDTDESAVARKAQKLLPDLPEDDRSVLQALLDVYGNAVEDDREGAEDALLDFLMELEADR